MWPDAVSPIRDCSILLLVPKNLHYSLPALSLTYDPFLHLKAYSIAFINTPAHIHPKPLTERILRFLVYFDLFSYPLKKDEIIAYLGLHNEQTKEVELILQKLLSAGILFQFGPFYTPRNEAGLAERREKGNLRTLRRMRTARRYSGLIASFPFVRGVFLSGSISKGFMSEKDDIDYLIVTKPGRLWIVRTLLTLFKKFFLLNSYRNFCINYFIDSDHLRFPGDDLYAATEVAFLIPTYGREVYKRVREANTWVQAYYPTFQQEQAFVLKKEPWYKKPAERILEGKPGDRLEAFLFRESSRFIQRRYRHIGTEAYQESFSLTPFEIRYFPGHTGLDILARFEAKLEAMRQYHSKLTSSNSR